jgi:hypothetical protein
MQESPHSCLTLMAIAGYLFALAWAAYALFDYMAKRTV